MAQIIDFKQGVNKQLQKAKHKLEIIEKVEKAHKMLSIAHLTGINADDIFRAAGLSEKEYLEYIGRQEVDSE